MNNKNPTWLLTKRVARSITSRLSGLAKVGLATLAVMVCAQPSAADNGSWTLSSGPWYATAHVEGAPWSNTIYSEDGWNLTVYAYTASAPQSGVPVELTITEVQNGSPGWGSEIDFVNFPITDGSGTEYPLVGIAQEAFSNPYGYYSYDMTTVRLPNTVTNIGSGAFYSCAALACVELDTTGPELTLGIQVFEDTDEYMTVTIWGPPPEFEQMQTFWNAGYNITLYVYEAFIHEWESYVDNYPYTLFDILVTGGTLESTLKVTGITHSWTPPVYIGVLPGGLAPLCDLSFDGNGGSSPSAMKKVQGGKYRTLPVSYRSGWSFIGWFTQQVGGTLVTSESIVPNQTVQKLYAQWNSLGVSSYTVTFDKNAGDATVPVPSTMTVTNGMTYGTLATVSRPGHTFEGWFTSPTGGSKVLPTTIVSLSGPQTLWAQWAPVQTSDEWEWYLDDWTDYGNTWTTLRCDEAGWILNVQTYGSSIDIIGIYMDGDLDLKLPSNVWDTYRINTIQPSAFSYSGLTSVSIPVVDYISYGAFGNCGSLLAVEIGDMSLGGASYIDDWAFENCSELNSITFTGAAPGSIAEYAFMWCGWNDAVINIYSQYASEWALSSGSFSDNTAVSQYRTNNSGYYIPLNLLDFGGSAVTTWTVTFNKNALDATTPVPSVMIVTNGLSYGTLPTVSRPGHTLDGWFTSTTGGSKIQPATIVSLSDDQMLYAQWTPVAIPTCVISFNGNGGSTPSSITRDQGAAYGTLPTSTYAGHSFDGWFTQQIGGTKVTSTSIVPSQSTQTLYAQWSPVVVPTEEWSFGTWNDPWGWYTTLVSTNGWILEVTVDPDGSIWIERTIQGASGDLNLPEMVWNDDLGMDCTLRGIMSSAFSWESMSAVEIPATVEYIGSQAFAYCYDLTDVTFLGSAPYFEDSYYVFQDTDYNIVINIYSQYANDWEALVEMGSFSDNSAMSSFLRTGYDWSYIPFNVMDFIPGPAVYVVTFNKNALDATTPVPATMTVTNGLSYGTLPTVSRLGHTFDGWFTLSSGGSKILATTIVSLSGPQTLWAQWTPVAVPTCVISFNGNGGSTPSPITRDQGAAYGTLPTSTYAGHSFNGWFTQQTGGTKVISTSIVPNQSTQTLYAQWTLVSDPGTWEWYLDDRVGSSGGYYTSLRCDAAGWHLSVMTSGDGSISISGVISYSDLDLQLPASVTADREYSIVWIEDRAFASSPITSVSIPDGVEYIGSYAFQYCSDLTEVVIGDMSSTARINDCAFGDCYSLTDVTFKGNPPDLIDSSAFWACGVDTKLNIYSLYTSAWEDYVSDGSFSDNTALSWFQRYTYGEYLPINVIDFMPGTDPSVDGHNGIPGDGDDIIIPGGIVDGNTGSITVPGTSDGSDVKHGDGSALEGGNAPGGSIIINPDIVIRPGTGADPVDNGDGTIYVNPGNTIDIDGDGKPPYVVPPNGGGDYDPETGTITTDEVPPRTIHVPGGVIIENDGTVTVPGHDGLSDTGDDIVIPVGQRDGDSGFVTVPDHYSGTDGNDVKHADGSNLEGGEVPACSIIVSPDIIIRPGTGDDPVDNGNGTITVNPGNTIDIDGDGKPPYVVPPNGAGDYDPETGTITTDEVPPRVIHVPGGVIIENDGTVTVPGHDGLSDTGDDIVIPVGQYNDDSGFVTFPGGHAGLGHEVKHADGSGLEGGEVPGGSIIASPDIIVRPGTGSDPADNGDGTIHVNPGNTIDIDGDGKPPYVVPPNGEGDYDPETGTITTDEVPPRVIHVPDGVIENPADGTVTVPGHDGESDTGDDIVIPGGQRDDDSGFVTVPGGSDVEHADGSGLEGGEVPGGSIIASPDIIVRPGTGTDPVDNGDGTITVHPGNTIDVDGDGKPAWEVQEEGTYDPETGVFTPDNGSNPSVLVPSGEELENGDTLVIPGHTASPDDDILVSPVDRNTVDDNGYVHVGGGQNAVHRDGSVFDDGAMKIPGGSIIIKPDLIIRPGTGAEAPKVNGDGTIKVMPGNTIDTDGDGLPPYVVVIGGDYDPETGTITTADVPPRVIHVPDNVIEDQDGTVTVPGHDGKPGTGDDIVIPGGQRDDDSGFITIPPAGGVEHADGSELEGGEAPGGSIIVGPDVIIRPGTGDTPVDNGDGTIHVKPGNTIDHDGDGQPPEVVTEEGDYNPKTGEFTPSGAVAVPVIIGIKVDGSTLTVTVSNCVATGKSYTLWGTPDLAQSFAPMTGVTGAGPVPVTSAAIVNGVWAVQGIPMTGNRFFFKAVVE